MSWRTAVLAVAATPFLAIAQGPDRGLAPGTMALVETAPVETTLAHADLPATAAVWLQMIGAARTEVVVGSFYASNQPNGQLEPIVRSLEAAGARGVAVRFLSDHGFYDTYPDTIDRLRRAPGVDVRLLDLRARTGGVHHAKYMVVDGVDLWVGSANFDWRALEHIQELGVRVHDAAVARAFVHVFDVDWQLAGGTTAREATRAMTPRAAAVALRFGDASVQAQPVFSPLALVPSGTRWDLPALLELIDGAQQSVAIQLLSYSRRTRGGGTFDTLDAALRRAAVRGVQVRLAVAHWAKGRKSIADLQALQRVDGIEVSLLTVPPARTGFIPFARVAHAKLMVVDDSAAWIGTSNWSGDYFSASRNAGLILRGSAIATRLAQWLDSNWNSALAERLDPDAHYGPVAVAEPLAEIDDEGKWPPPTELYEVERVVDGDTVHVRMDGNRVRLRLLSVDTEEKSDSAASPTKPRTRYGVETAQWAAELFAALATESSPARVGLRFPGGTPQADRYGRLLCHVVLPDGTDYNLQLVREGRSPYFNKYGNSLLCHEAFARAEQAARKARRGVWDPATNAGSAARPYDLLLPWWRARAAAIDAFRHRQAAEPDRYIAAEDPSALKRAADSGATVTVFGTLEKVEDAANGGLAVVFRGQGTGPGLRAFVPPTIRAALEPALRASLRELQANFWWVEGKIERTSHGHALRAPAAERWQQTAPTTGR